MKIKCAILILCVSIGLCGAEKDSTTNLTDAEVDAIFGSNGITMRTDTVHQDVKRQSLNPDLSTKINDRRAKFLATLQNRPVVSNGSPKIWLHFYDMDELENEKLSTNRLGYNNFPNQILGDIKSAIWRSKINCAIVHAGNVYFQRNDQWFMSLDGGDTAIKDASFIAMPVLPLQEATYYQAVCQKAGELSQEKMVLLAVPNNPDISSKIIQELQSKKLNFEKVTEQKNYSFLSKIFNKNVLIFGIPALIAILCYLQWNDELLYFGLFT